MENQIQGATATYSPDDNKLRLYTVGRLDKEDYVRARGLGFRWAPKQELFVCPSWSPQAEDLLLEWCGEIDDEDSSLVDRAEERAERFGGYSEKRAKDSERALEAVSSITEHIPLGQPILVGHHSARRARKDAERIERGMARAVKMWETSEYWEQRAAGALASARYKETPAVRARRIKRLEAERRKRVASYTPHGREFMQGQSAYLGRGEDGTGRYCWQEHGHDSTCDNCKETLHVFVGNKGRGAHPVPIASLPRIKAGQARWIAHIDRRLAYEKALLGERGASSLLEKAKRPKQPPLLNYKADGGDLKVWQRHNRDSPEVLRQVEMTKAEYAAIYKDNRWTVLSEDRSHRIRFASVGGWSGDRVCVYLTDSKAHAKPEGVTA